MHVRHALLVALLVGTAALLAPTPASASPSLRLSRSTGLDPAGDFVTASGSGFKANVQLFVMQCRATSGEDHTCNSVGLQKVTTDAGGNFTANPMRVVARFGATDCTQVACAIKTSAVSDHVDDRSQDRSAAISFTAPTTTTAAPTTTPPVATTAPPVATTAATTTTTAAVAATTTTSEPGTTTTKAGPTTTTTEADDHAGSTTTTEAGASSSLDETDDGGSGSTAAVVGGVAALGAVAAGAIVAVRRRNAATGPSAEPKID